MAKRNTGRRGGSRKRRPASQPLSAGDGAAERNGAAADTVAADPARELFRQAHTHAQRRARRRRELRGRLPGPGSFGERPQAPWHPVPVAEILILVGAIGTIIGVRRGFSHGGPLLIAGLAAVVIGTVEVSLREHLSGYRSHTIMLALLPVIVLHSVVVLGLAAATTVPPIVNVAMLAVDGAVFAFLYKLLRARFLDARRERVFAAKR